MTFKVNQLTSKSRIPSFLMGKILLF